MSSQSLTSLLAEASEGDAEARDALWHRVYPELRKIAHRELERRRPGQTLQTTVLVHEAYLKLVDQTQTEWEDRIHFYALSATAMRHIVIDYARRKLTEKRGGDQKRIELNEGALIAEGRAETLLLLDKALSRLSTLNERLGRVVEYRFFGGMTEEEIAGLLRVSKRTVRRDWRKARAWLTAELSDAS